MLLELCVTELEDVASDRESGRSLAQPIVQESPHPYTDDTSLNGHVKIQGIDCLFAYHVLTNNYIIFVHVIRLKITQLNIRRGDITPLEK